MGERADSGPHSVSPQPHFKPNPEMSSIGLAIAAGIAILLLPLLPFVAVVWGASKLVGDSH